MRSLTLILLTFNCIILAHGSLNLNIRLGENECIYGAITPTSTPCDSQEFHFNKLSSASRYCRPLFEDKIIKYIRVSGSKYAKLDCSLTNGGINTMTAEVRIRSLGNLKESDIYCEVYCEPIVD